MRSTALPSRRCDHHGHVINDALTIVQNYTITTCRAALTATLLRDWLMFVSNCCVLFDTLAFAARAILCTTCGTRTSFACTADTPRQVCFTNSDNTHLTRCSCGATSSRLLNPATCTCAVANAQHNVYILATVHFLQSKQNIRTAGHVRRRGPLHKSNST